MAGTVSELIGVVDRFEGTQMVVVGDLILDHYIWGKVNRISPEAPVVVVQVTEESKRPGGAGNVAKNLLELGSKVNVCGVVGDDEEGRHVVADLTQSGAEIEGVLVDRARPTTQKTRVIAHAQQVVRVDRENTEPLNQAITEGIGGALQASFDRASGIIISDYSKGAVSSLTFDRIKAGYEAGKLGFGKIPVLVDPKAPNFSLYSKATIIKPNRGEAAEACGFPIPDRKAALEAGSVLLKKWGCEMVLITLGEDGMVLVSEESAQEPAIEIDTVAREVFDVSGAGDTVSAVFALSLAVGSTRRQAAVLANLSAGIVVAEVGTAAVTVDQLRNAITKSENL